MPRIPKKVTKEWTLHIRIDDQMSKKIAMVAKKIGCTRGALMRQAAEEYCDGMLKKLERKKGGARG